MTEPRTRQQIQDHLDKVKFREKRARVMKTLRNVIISILSGMAVYGICQAVIIALYAWG